MSVCEREGVRKIEIEMESVCACVYVMQLHECVFINLLYCSHLSSHSLTTEGCAALQCTCMNIFVF